jgi:sialidase-1
VVDERTGKICLLATWNLGEDREALIHSGKSRDTRRVFVTASSDDGLHWEKPKDITADVKQPGWSWYATGPCHGIQLQHGLRAGRLLIPCDHIAFANPHGGYSHVIYSDDGGQSWRLGGIVPEDVGNECSVAELPNGTLMMNMRNYRKGARYRIVSTSTDGGMTWSAVYADSTLIEPRCQGSLVNDPGRKKPFLFFSNPADSSARKNMTLRKSPDNGKTWPYVFVVYPGPSAYSDLAVVNKRIAILYESGYKKPYEGIAFRRIPIKKIKKKN